MRTGCLEPASITVPGQARLRFAAMGWRWQLLCASLPTPRPACCESDHRHARRLLEGKRFRLSRSSHPNYAEHRGAPQYSGHRFARRWLLARRYAQETEDWRRADDRDELALSMPWRSAEHGMG